MLPELLFSESLTLIFFLVVILIITVMIIHHYLESRKRLTTREIIANHPFRQVLPNLAKEVDDSDLEAYYKEDLQKALDMFVSDLNTQSQAAQAEFISYLGGLKTQAQQDTALLDAAKQARIDTIFTDLEGSLKQTVAQTVNQTLTNIQKELEYSRKLVDEYTQKQLTLIDQNVIDLLERTLSLVLVKKLTLRDQLDLVYAALETAKIEKFLVPTETSPQPPSPPSTPPNPPTPPPIREDKSPK